MDARERRARQHGRARSRIPDRFTEQGEPPLLTITDPAKPGGGIEVTRGRVLLRFVSDAGTVTSELCDPPHPPANKPLVTIRRGPGGRPEVTVTEGRARIRLLDEYPSRLVWLTLYGSPSVY